jgi:hypothetical protein
MKPKSRSSRTLNESSMEVARKTMDLHLRMYVLLRFLVNAALHPLCKRVVTNLILGDQDLM